MLQNCHIMLLSSELFFPVTRFSAGFSGVEELMELNHCLTVTGSTICRGKTTVENMCYSIYILFYNNAIGYRTYRG